MSMATLESLEHKPANLLSSVDKAALFDQIWNDDSSEMMVLAGLFPITPILRWIMNLRWIMKF